MKPNGDQREIPPGTPCIIKGWPRNEGKIVVVEHICVIFSLFEGGIVYHVSPDVIANDGKPENHCLGRVLYPLDNPPEGAIDTHSTRAKDPAIDALNDFIKETL